MVFAEDSYIDSLTDTAEVSCSNILESIQSFISLSEQSYFMLATSASRLANSVNREQDLTQVKEDITEASYLIQENQFLLSDKAFLIMETLPSCLKK